MGTLAFRQSYGFKLGFYLGVLALPLILMAVVETFAGGSAVSISSNDPSRFFTFVIYFLPGLIMTRKTTESWWRTLGVGVAYALFTPAYYLGALQLACSLGNNCVSV